MTILTATEKEPVELLHHELPSDDEMASIEAQRVEYECQLRSDALCYERLLELVPA